MKTALNHMMLHEDTLADEFDAILNYRTTHTGIVLPGGSAYAGHNSVVFDGVSDYLARGAIPDGFADAQYATIAFKIKPANLSAIVNIAHWGAANKRAILTTTGTIQVNASGWTDNFSRTSTSTLSAGSWTTVHIAIRGDAVLANTGVRMWFNGVEDGSLVNWGGNDDGLMDFGGITNMGIFGSTAGVAPFPGEVGFFIMKIGNTTASYITDPTVFYDGGDVDLSDFLAAGATPANIFFGGTQEAADWNAGTNQGSGADTWTMGGDVVDGS